MLPFQLTMRELCFSHLILQSLHRILHFPQRPLYYRDIKDVTNLVTEQKNGINNLLNSNYKGVTEVAFLNNKIMLESHD